MINIEGLTGCVVLPDSPCYDEARRDYNARFNKFPLIIVYCYVTQDVINAILWVRKYRLPFRIRCGGHSYEAFSLVDGGLIIDISGLQKLQVHTKNLTMKVGAGFRPTQLYEILWQRRLTVPSGTCPTVGISGLALGGGYGLLSRPFGMTCDNLIEAEMVMADGKLVRASRDQHSDLFWACRGGGGGNFGIMTSFTFRLHPIENISRYKMTWDFSNLKNVVRYWQKWAPNADPRMTSLLALPAQNLGDLRSNGIFIGSEQELREMMHPMQEATQPKTVEFYSTTWIETARLFAGIPLKQEKFKNSSAYVYELLTDEALDVMIHHLQTAPGNGNVIAFEACGGLINEVPAAATAFVHRDALFLIQYQSYWNQDVEAEENIDWIEQFRKSMLPYTRGAYRNYCDTLIEDWPTAYYGENLAKLKEVKQRYDPENLFRFEQSIPV